VINVEFMDWFFKKAKEKAFYGHAGRPGHVGGSVPASSAMSRTTGAAAVARMQGVAGSKIGGANPAVAVKPKTRVEVVRAKLGAKTGEYAKRESEVDRLLAKRNEIVTKHNELGYDLTGMSGEEMTEHYRKQKELDAEYKKANKEYRTALESINSEFLADIAVDDPIELTMVVKQSGRRISKKREAELQEATDLTASITSKDTLGVVSGGTGVDVTVKGSRAGYYHTSKVINIGVSGQSGMVHELGHHIEDSYPVVKNKANTFLSSRTQGEKQKLIKGAPGEYSYHDKFMDAYCGKTYPQTRSTEIISMGLQYLASSPVKFYNEDPEYFDFMIDVLQGE